MSQILTSSQIAEFHGQGFVRIDGLFSEAEIAELEGACDRVHAIAEQLVAEKQVGGEQGNSPVRDGSRFTFQADGDSFAVRHVAWCGQCEPVFDRFGRDARLLRITGELLGCDQATQLINQIHYKKPGTAVKFDWHQDAAHRGIHKGGFKDVAGNGSYVQIAVAIDPVAADAGPLGFIPGSNRHGFLGPLYDEQGKLTCDKIDPNDAVYPLLNRGDAVAFGSYTVHGSEANTGRQGRRTFINGFAYPGADLKQPRLPGEGRLLDIPQEAGV